MWLFSPLLSYVRKAVGWGNWIGINPVRRNYKKCFKYFEIHCQLKIKDSFSHFKNHLSPWSQYPLQQRPAPSALSLFPRVHCIDEHPLFLGRMSGSHFPLLPRLCLRFLPLEGHQQSLLGWPLLTASFQEVLPTGLVTKFCIISMLNLK